MVLSVCSVWKIQIYHWNVFYKNTHTLYAVVRLVKYKYMIEMLSIKRRTKLCKIGSAGANYVKVSAALILRDKGYTIFHSW